MGSHPLLPVLGAQGPAGLCQVGLEQDPGKGSRGRIQGQNPGAGSRGRIQGQSPGGFLAQTREEREVRQPPDEGGDGSGSCSGSD